MHTTSTIADDILAIARINAVPEILQVVIRTTGLRFAAVARVTDSTWTTCAVHDLIEFGLKPGDELVLESTICNEIRQHRQPVIFGHASQHPVFATHHTPLQYGFESYISIPIIRADGEFFGTLCALDTLPAQWDEAALAQTLGLLAQLIAANLDMQERLDSSDLALRSERETAQLREQFIAVLGHDLRSPLGAVRLAADAILRKPESAVRLSTMIINGVSRMSELIDDVLDFARGQLGGGLSLQRTEEPQLGNWLHQVISETQAARNGHSVQSTIDLPTPIFCDRVRIGQLLSNLLTNAMVHGATDQPIEVSASLHGERFELRVSNRGPQIAEHLMPRLFEPFTRAEAPQKREGLGLGLYIAAQIAKAHGGALQVDSSAAGTCFTCTFETRPTC